MYDLVIQGGHVVDGTGASRFVADVAITGGRIAKIGQWDGASARRVIDGRGKIVAPGIIDLHTHYDTQIHWDPYCKSSGWHGTTTVAVGNCGIGFAPCRRDPILQDRYMLMMERTEQIPYQAMREVLPWSWETFPQWLEHLKRVPKGVNIASYLPMNALLSYVIGPDEAKRRPATEMERARMRELLDEAMDAGACGFAFSHLGLGGAPQLDYDSTPMPSDTMAADEVYNLAAVLRKRDQGTIQAIVELPGMHASAIQTERGVIEELARISGRPVLHNVTTPVDGQPELHRDVLKWLDGVDARGLNVYSQGFTFRSWFEMTVSEYNTWDGIAIFREFSVQDEAGKLKLAGDPDYRRRLGAQYRADEMGQAAGALESYVLLDACGVPAFAGLEILTLEEIANARKQRVTDAFLDVVHGTGLKAQFRTSFVSQNPDYVVECLRHPRVIAGLSDGGAHSKFLSLGFYSTDIIIWLVRETGKLSLEEAHEMLSGRPAKVLGLSQRGVLKEGYAADLMIYDLDALDYTHGKYAIMHDMPGGDWCRTVPVRGIDHIIVNGEATFENGASLGTHPGRLVGNGGEAVDAKLQDMR